MYIQFFSAIISDQDRKEWFNIFKYSWHIFYSYLLFYVYFFILFWLLAYMDIYIFYGSGWVGIFMQNRTRHEIFFFFEIWVLRDNIGRLFWFGIEKLYALKIREFIKKENQAKCAQRNLSELTEINVDWSTSLIIWR